MEVYRGNAMSVTYENKWISYYKMFLFIVVGIVVWIAMMHGNVIVEQLRLLEPPNQAMNMTQNKKLDKDLDSIDNNNNDNKKNNNQMKKLYNELNHKKEKKKEDSIQDSSSRRSLQMINAYRGIPYREKLISDTKNGYCFIGSENGYRSCVRVNINDKCMSNEIYASKRICQHPELRE